MHKMLVDERKWISNDRFLHALNYFNPPSWP
jgi:chromate transport protein ChrA